MLQVEFRYWGMQSRIEHYIDDYGLRRMMVRAHRQAWVWQDEWIGLTMKDIRKLERETQIILRKKLGKSVSDDEPDGDSEDSDSKETTLTKSTINAATTDKALPTSNGSVVSGIEVATQSMVTHVESSPDILQSGEPTEQKKTSETVTTTDTANVSQNTESSDIHDFNSEHVVTMRHSIDTGELAERRLSKKSSSLRHRSLKRNSRQSKRQSSLPDAKMTIDGHRISSASILSARRRISSTDSEYHLPYCGLDAVAMMNMSSDDEYYDALGELFTMYYRPI